MLVGFVALSSALEGSSAISYMTVEDLGSGELAKIFPKNFLLTTGFLDLMSSVEVWILLAGALGGGIDFSIGVLEMPSL